MAKARNTAHAEEKAEVEVLSADAIKYGELAKKLRALQASLEGGGRTVRDAIGPVHSNTREHQIMIHNIDRLDAHIDKMLEPGQDKGKEERIIRVGPSKFGLNEYLASLKRVERALSQMTATNIRANQQAIGDFNELLSEGSNKLQDLFRTALMENVQKVEPLHYITKQQPFPVIQQEKVTYLSAMDRFISPPSARNASSSQRESPSVRIYSECRSPYLVNTLQNLSIASISTSKRKNADEPYRQGTSAIGTYSSAMEGLFLAELQNISGIFPREDWGIAIEITSRKALADFAKTLRELNMHIKSNLTTECFLAYEIIEIVTNIAHRVNSATGDVKLPFADALKPIRETAKQSLPDLLEDQRRRITSITTLPADGSALTYTAETLTRLQTMCAYPKSLSSILTSLGDGNWTHLTSGPGPSNSSTSIPSLKSLDVGADGTQLLTHYILDTIETHLTSLDARARILYKSKAVHGVFISNTLALIDRMIRSSDLASLLSQNPSAQSKLDTWCKKGVSTYMDAWREPSSALFDVQYTNRSGPRPQSGTSVSSAEVVKSLSSKDKDAIKEKFKLFNSSFDECVRRHKELSGGMEREVKSSLGREVGNMVEPLYGRFWDRYEALDKGKGKYVKYDKGQLAAVLASLG
ncbi:hypothetical protein OEA41_007823 [Lepraria neglecta]|uniref:Exocyst complex protein EXO70 n=1 Tax=Lepraria neglecta TaxID=209136 RepID=A0AAD9ZGE1_9LECA|nr:hypothetical protein OEA41_007823 [Lepraria neglecta]